MGQDSVVHDNPGRQEESLPQLGSPQGWGVIRLEICKKTVPGPGPPAEPRTKGRVPGSRPGPRSRGSGAGAPAPLGPRPRAGARRMSRVIYDTFPAASHAGAADAAVRSRAARTRHRTRGCCQGAALRCLSCAPGDRPFRYSEHRGKVCNGPPKPPSQKRQHRRRTQGDNMVSPLEARKSC